MKERFDPLADIYRMNEDHIGTSYNDLGPIEEPPHPGIYGAVAELLESIRSGTHTFKNAPLGPRQKIKLRKSISEQEERLRELRVKLDERTEYVKNNRDFNPNLSCSVRHNDRVFRPLDGSVMCDACYWRKSVSMRKGRPHNVWVPQKA